MSSLYARRFIWSLRRKASDGILAGKHPGLRGGNHPGHRRSGTGLPEAQRQLPQWHRDHHRYPGSDRRDRHLRDHHGLRRGLQDHRAHGDHQDHRQGAHER